MKMHSLRCVFTYSLYKNLPGTGVGTRSKSVVSKTPSLPYCGILGRKMNKNTIKTQIDRCQDWNTQQVLGTWGSGNVSKRSDICWALKDVQGWGNDGRQTSGWGGWWLRGMTKLAEPISLNLMENTWAGLPWGPGKVRLTPGVSEWEAGKGGNSLGFCCPEMQSTVAGG